MNQYCQLKSDGGDNSGMFVYVDGLVQNCSNSSALTMGLLQSCTKSSVWATALMYYA